MYYGQVQKKEWTQLPDTREDVGWFTTPVTGLNLLMTGADLLDAGTGTSVVSQRSETGQRILCTKEDR